MQGTTATGVISRNPVSGKSWTMAEECPEGSHSKKLRITMVTGAEAKVILRIPRLFICEKKNTTGVDKFYDLTKAFYFVLFWFLKKSYHGVNNLDFWLL